MSGLKNLSQPISEMAKFQSILQKASKILVLTGAGISAESGVPTFRGSGGLWRTYRSQDLATPQAFRRSPSLVWEFYHYRRELVLTKQPNKAHIAIAEAEKVLADQGKSLTVVTQNVDGLHLRAGSKNVIELHGNLYKTRCLECGTVEDNSDSPIVPALKDRGAPDPSFKGPEIPLKDLPHCNGCGGLLRPHIVWFGENLDPEVLNKTDIALAECEACLVVGTSSVVYPAAMYAPALAARNIPVAEFNIESTPATSDLMFHFRGPCTQTVPEALSVFVKSIALNKNNTSALNEWTIFDNFARDYSAFSNKHEVAFHYLSSRNYSRSSARRSDKWNEEKKEESDDNKSKQLKLREKLKLAMRDYGSTVIVFHIGHSLTLLGIIYLALSSGLDVKWMLESVGLSGTNIAAGASTFVAAYAVNKVLAPVRISITLAATPFIVRYLRKVGVLKTPPPTPK